MVFALTLTVVQRLIGFGRGLLFCRVMPDDQLGQWSLVYSFVLLLAPLAMLGLPGSFCRYVEHYRQGGQLGHFLVRITRVCLGSALVFSAVMLVCPDSFSWIFFRESEVQLVRAMSLAIFSSVIFFYLTSLLESLCQVRLVTVMRFVMAMTFAVCN